MVSRVHDRHCWLRDSQVQSREQRERETAVHQSCAARRYVTRIESAARLYLALFAAFIVLVKAVKLAGQAKEAQEFSRVPGILHKCWS